MCLMNYSLICFFLPCICFHLAHTKFSKNVSSSPLVIIATFLIWIPFLPYLAKIPLFLIRWLFFLILHFVLLLQVLYFPVDIHENLKERNQAYKLGGVSRYKTKKFSLDTYIIFKKHTLLKVMWSGFSFQFSY